jgi:hypothetical protein
MKNRIGPRFSVLLPAFLFLFPGTSASQQRKAGDLQLKPYVFETTRGEKITAEFGVLTVPERRNNPQSNLIELAFVRFKSTARRPRSPIVYLAGGPGGSGIAAWECRSRTSFAQRDGWTFRSMSRPRANF